MLSFKLRKIQAGKSWRQNRRPGGTMMTVGNGSLADTTKLAAVPALLFNNKRLTSSPSPRW